MKNRPDSQKSFLTNIPMIPILFFLALLSVSAVRLAPANAWFTARITADRPSVQIALGAAGADCRTSLTVSGWEALHLAEDDLDALSAAIADMDFAAAEHCLAFLSREAQGGDADHHSAARAYAIRYTISCGDDGGNLPGVYVRLATSHSFSNMVTVNGFQRDCVQTLMYTGPDGELLPMPRLSLRGQGFHYYYPLPLEAGDQVEMEYLLFFPGGFGEDILDGERLLRHETIQSRNNASVFWWNVVVQDGAVAPFDQSDIVETPYAAYELEYAPPAETGEEAPPPAPEESVSGSDEEEEPLADDDEAQGPPEEIGEEKASATDQETDPSLSEESAIIDDDLWMESADWRWDQERLPDNGEELFTIITP